MRSSTRGGAAAARRHRPGSRCRCILGAWRRRQTSPPRHTLVLAWRGASVLTSRTSRGRYGMEQDDVTMVRADGYVVVTLARPAKRNALTFAMRRRLAAVLAAVGDDAEVRCLVLTGAAPDFCAGMDVSVFGGDAANRREIVDS